jgi:hypothetical protein
VTPSLGSLTTSFQFSAAGSLDFEDSGNLHYRWDYENDGVFDTALSANPATSHSYDSAGSKTAKVEVRDQICATMTRTVPADNGCGESRHRNFRSEESGKPDHQRLAYRPRCKRRIGAFHK